MTAEVSRWVAHWPVPFTVAMAEAGIAKAREAATRGDAPPFAVERLGGGLAGWIMVNRAVATPRLATFGHWFGTAHYGQGFMREAVPPAVAAGFRVPDVDRIEAAVQRGKEASMAVLRRCGFVRNGRAWWRPRHASGRNSVCFSRRTGSRDCDLADRTNSHAPRYSLARAIDGPNNEERTMRMILTTTAGFLMLTGAAMAQTATTPPTATQPPASGYSTNGPMVSSNGAPVAPNGGLQSGVGTTLANPNTPPSSKPPVGANTGK